MKRSVTLTKRAHRQAGRGLIHRTSTWQSARLARRGSDEEADAPREDWNVQDTSGVDAQIASPAIHTGMACYPLWPPAVAHGAAQSAVPNGAAPIRKGATPQAEGLVRAWGWVCFHTPVPALQGSLPVHQSLAGRLSSAGGGGAVRRSAISAPAGGLGGRCPRPPAAPAAARGRRDVCAPFAAWVHQRLGVRQTPRAERRPVGIPTRWPRSSKLSTGSATWTRRAACGWSGRGDARDMAGDADGLRSLAGPAAAPVRSRWSAL